MAGRPYQYSSASYVRLAQIRRISRKLRVAPSSLLCKRGARLRERADLTKYDEDGQRVESERIGERERGGERGRERRGRIAGRGRDRGSRRDAPPRDSNPGRRACVTSYCITINQRAITASRVVGVGNPDNHFTGQLKVPLVNAKPI